MRSGPATTQYRSAEVSGSPSLVAAQDCLEVVVSLAVGAKLGAEFEHVVAFRRGRRGFVDVGVVVSPVGTGELHCTVGLVEMWTLQYSQREWNRAV